MADATWDERTLDAMLAAIRDRLDAGPTPGTVTIYDGEPDAGTVLGVLTLSRPCAGAPKLAAMDFAPVSEDPLARASGTASWARLAAGDGSRVIDIDVSDEAGDGLLKLTTTDIRAGGPIRISTMRVTF